MNKQEVKLGIGNYITKILANKRFMGLVYGTSLFALSTILSKTILFQRYAPFSFVFTAASAVATSGFSALMGSFFGYFVLTPGIDGLKYAAAALLAVATANVFKDMKAFRHPLFMPFVSALTLGATGFIYVWEGGFLPQDWILYLAELTMAAAATYFFSLLFRPSEKERAGLYTALSIVFCGVVLAFGSIHIGDMVSVSRVIACLFLLTIGFLGDISFALPLAVIAGFLVDASGSNIAFFMGVYSFSVLLSSYFAKLGKLAYACVFFIATMLGGLIGLELSLYVSSMYECLAAFALFLCLPHSLFARLKELKKEKQVNNPVYAKEIRQQSKGFALDLSYAFYELGLLLENKAVEHKLRNDEEMELIFNKAADKVCKKCPICNVCWEKDYITTLNAINDASIQMFRKGRAEAADFPIHFSSRCLKMKEFLEAINDSLSVILQRHYLNFKMNENKQLIREQYLSLNSILKQFSMGLGEGPEFLPRSEEAVMKYVSLFGKCSSVTVYRTKNRRLSVEIQGDCIEKIMYDGKSFIVGLNKVLNTDLYEPEQMCNLEEKKLIIRQKEPLKGKIGLSIQKKPGELYSGDSCNYFISEDGKIVVILSDGMGSGQGAYMESTAVLKIMERFLRSGLSAADSIKAVHPALKMQGTMIALDVATIDLYTGSCEIVKLSTAPTFVCDKEGVRKVFSEFSIKNGESPDITRLKLLPGDKLVLISDGICDGMSDRWLAQMLKGERQKESRLLAADIVTQAKERKNEDDMTAFVLTLEKI